MIPNIKKYNFNILRTLIYASWNDFFFFFIKAFIHTINNIVSH